MCAVAGLAVLCADLPPARCHMQHDRANKMRVHKRNYSKKIRCLVQTLGNLLPAVGSVSTTGTACALESAISLLSDGAGGDGKNTASSETTVESPPIIPPVVEATQTQAHLVARAVVLPLILRAPPTEIIVPAGTLPVAMSSYDHPSLTPLAHLEILRMHAADAMIDLAEAGIHHDWIITS